ncbi:MAG: hypothetical protein IT289_13285 [Oligoflexia bacterium]|nr:hypothetical protein [Oligoflexia bacterium]
MITRLLVATTLMLGLATQSHAQTVVAATGANPGYFNPGTYEIVTPSQLQQQYLSLFQKRTEANLQLYIQKEAELRNELQSLLRDTIYGSGSLTDLSNQAAATQGKNPVKAEVFLAALANYNKQKTLVLAKIEGLVQMGQALPASEVQTGEKSPIGQLPVLGAINMGPLASFYQNILVNEENRLKNLPHVVEVNGKPLIIVKDSGKGLELNSPYAILDPSVVRQKQEEIKAARRETPEYYDSVARLNQYLLSQIKTFVTTYGTEERWRFQGSNQAYQTERQDVAESIARAFYVRSFIRTSLGVPVGAIGISFQKRKLKLDRFADVSAYQRLISEMLWRDEDLKRARNAYTEALAGLQMKTTNPFEGGIMQGNFKILERANGLITALKGDKPVAEALSIMLTYMAADLYEEITVREVGGSSNKLFNIYTQRYKQNGQVDAFLADTEATLKGMLTGSSGASSSLAGASGSIMSLTSDIVLEGTNWANRLDQAALLEAQLINTNVVKKINDRLNRM